MCRRHNAPSSTSPAGFRLPKCTLTARGGEESECGKELVGAPRGRDGCGSSLATKCGGGGLWIKRPSTACGPQHLALCTPERIEVWGALAAEDTRHPARTRQPVGHLPHLAPSLLQSWLPRFSLGLSCSLPLSSLTLQLCHLFAWPLWPLSLPHFRMSLKHFFGSLFWRFPELWVSAGSGSQGSHGLWAGDHWDGMAAYCQGVPITGCVPLPDFLGTLKLELTKVDIW